MIRPLLLHLANSRPPSVHSREFYDFKRLLLMKRGRRVGEDVQEIIKPCYGRRGGEYGDFDGCTKRPDCRCRGTGIFDRRRYYLQRWQWGGFIFHCPVDVWGGFAHHKITITGRIKHKDYGRLSYEAAFWLYLLSGQFRLFWRTFRGSCCYGPYLYPLLNLQRLIFPLTWRLRRERCIYCDRRFFSWGSGWCVCNGCRRRRTENEVENMDEVPF